MKKSYPITRIVKVTFSSVPFSRAVSLAQTITQPRRDRRMARIQRRRRRGGAQRDAPSTWLRAAAVGGTR